MQSEKSKLLIIIALLSIVMIIGTCSIIQHPRGIDHSQTEDTIVSLWKKEKEQLQKNYEARISKLETDKDSLQVIVKVKKKALAKYQAKTSYLEIQLRQAILKVDRSGLYPDSLMPAANEYFTAEAQGDTICNETISMLESIVGNRDSTIVLFKAKEENVRLLQQEQELRNRLLTEQLNTAYKQQKKKILQNKLLAGGLIFISGFTTTLIVRQTLK